MTSRCGSRYGRGRSTTPSSKLNTAVAEPMPKPNASTAAMVKLGLRRKLRNAYGMSRQRLSMSGGTHTACEASRL